MVKTVGLWQSNGSPRSVATGIEVNDCALRLCITNAKRLSIKIIHFVDRVIVGHLSLLVFRAQPLCSCSGAHQSTTRADGVLRWWRTRWQWWLSRQHRSRSSYFTDIYALISTQLLRCYAIENYNLMPSIIDCMNVRH